LSEATTAPLLNDGYHWRIRAVDSLGLRSAFVNFDPAPVNHFITTSPPPGGGGSDNANGDLGVNDNFCGSAVPAGAGNFVWLLLLLGATLVAVRRGS
jgi:hypothetical protein